MSLPENEVPPILPGPKVGGCPEVNGTFVVKDGEDTVEIRILPGILFYLSAGRHEIFLRDENCTIEINVRKGD